MSSRADFAHVSGPRTGAQKWNSLTVLASPYNMEIAILEILQVKVSKLINYFFLASRHCLAKAGTKTAAIHL